jgi:hypothetical protein
MSDRATASIVARLRRYGLRVMCSRCAQEQRHFPQSGRLRDARCTDPARIGCRGQELRAVAWVDENPERWGELVGRTRARLAPFSRV